MLFLSKSEKETQKAAKALAKEIVTKHSRKREATVIGLEGELGAGKTVFAKGFARGLGVKKKVTSPTFVLMKTYNLQLTAYNNLFHIDAYRLKDEKDFLALGMREIMGNSGNVILIEWSDRVKKALPKKYLKIHLDHISPQTRKITLTNYIG